jgi:hypothetical protein
VLCLGQTIARPSHIASLPWRKESALTDDRLWPMDDGFCTIVYRRQDRLIDAQVD